jgi:hypothetical protein
MSCRGQACHRRTDKGAAALALKTMQQSLPLIHIKKPIGADG